MPIQDATSPLRRVYVRPPSAGDLAAWRDYAWHAAPDAGAAADEHAKLQATLQEAGAEGMTLTFAYPTEVSRPYMPDPQQLFEAHRVPTIDSSARSVEEMATVIIQQLARTRRTNRSAR